MPRLIRRVVRTAAIAGTATAVSGRVSRRQSGRWAQQDQQQNQQNQQAQPQQAQAPSGADPAAAQAQGAVPPPMPPDDEMGRKIDRLKELGELKAQGLLTEQEFAAEKQKVLG
ncbi:SHOCT domain-containing protein [Streptomyces sp. ICN441]|uniref:SHOCT domain-containing protein n=1 Tax=Streptomyces tirandamycinicus TaxID=2174846 RepID=A0A2S1SZM4_9ACTN|nr:MULTISPECIES: SHOCT domain-containing protein [Streptomyces]AWI31864.1 SHOCT domain-containing protein [Streptomyces tirandamycinicus]MCY0982029.1 SHOCT domain-containing protein [Streptomyces tirandamycinicus]NNJ07281.1 SHOCT domain-containing protein [Streptomyces sp. PKU-MA01144]TFE49869.1 SHOCT domain-containing protein [Streptomyces sp. ICN441]